MRLIVAVTIMAVSIAALLNSPLTEEDRYRIMVKQENEKSYTALKQSLNNPHESSPIF